MENSGLVSVKKSFAYIITLSIVCILISGHMSSALAADKHKFPDEHEHQISGNTYTDKTFSFQVTLPNTNWTIKPTKEGIGDALQIAMLERKGYDGFATNINVSKYYHESLEKFAGIGTYNPKKAKYTYVAGKPAFVASKMMTSGNFELQSIVYKLVNNGLGYIFSIAYISQWSDDERLQMEIDELLNSFTLLSGEDKKGESQISVGGKIGKEKLNSVAVLVMVDLRSDKPSEKTTVLTNELQNMLTKTGKFECLDRRNIDKTLGEQAFQQSGMISGDSAVKLGKLVGAKYLISSNLGQIGETSVIYIQITEVESGKIIKTASSRCTRCNDDMLFNTISNLVSKLIF